MEYPEKPDGKLTFDLPRSLYLSGTNHDHGQVGGVFSFALSTTVLAVLL